MNKPQRWVIGNWKMNGSLTSNDALLGALTAAPPQVGSGVRVAVCVPFPYLAQVQTRLAGSRIELAAQDVCDQTNGAYTGQVSAAMLKEFGTALTLVGHSERRQLNAENSELIARKAQRAFDEGLISVICVGETLAEREAGAAESTVTAQLSACRDLLVSAGDGVAGRVIIAYEPVWAIGTGKTASPAEAQTMHAHIRAWLGAIRPAAQQVSVLYGGSVKAANARELFAQPDIDGGLVGGASLNAVEFLGIVAAAG